MLKFLGLCLASLAALMPVRALAEKAGAENAAAPTAAAALPSIEMFGRLPFIEEPALSPDGTHVAGFFGVGGRQLIGILPLFDKNEKMRTFALPEGVTARWVRWVNEANVVVGVDTLYPVDGQRWYISRMVGLNRLSGKVAKLLWDLNGQDTADVLWIPSDGSAEILVAAQGSIYMEPDFWPSVYRVDVETGKKRRVVAGHEGVLDWSADAAGNVRTGLAFQNGGRMFRLLYRDAGQVSFKTIDTANTRKREGLLSPFLFIPGTTRALTLHDDDKGRLAVYETDLATREDVRQAFAMPEGRAEVGSAVLSEDGAAALGFTTTRADGAIYWIDKGIAALQEQFDKAVPGKTVRIVSFNRDRKRMLVTISAPHHPGSLYFYDVDDGALRKIADMNEGLKPGQLAPVRLVSYKSRDGLEIEAVLTLPRGGEGRKLPFIIMPHGGPWAQDGLGYDYWAQFLASRGYGVLQPNFRGSTGYGTDFLRKGEGQLGLAMQDDLSDGLAWAVKEGLADSKRVCIVGASYGGYAAMWGIAKDPALYRCAISIAGVSSLRAEVNDFGDKLMGGKYRDDWQRMTPDFPAVSPINAVDRIKAPLLLIHGNKDVTVDDSQSSRMAAKMKAAGKTVDYLPLPLADHYFTREADRIALLSAMAAFLDKYNPATP